MGKKTKILIAILGGCIVGGLGVVGSIFTSYATALALVSGGIAIAIGLITGIPITRENKQPNQPPARPSYGDS